MSCPVAVCDTPSSAFNRYLLDIHTYFIPIRNCQQLKPRSSRVGMYSKYRYLTERSVVIMVLVYLTGMYWFQLPPPSCPGVQYILHAVISSIWEPCLPVVSQSPLQCSFPSLLACSCLKQHSELPVKLSATYTGMYSMCSIPSTYAAAAYTRCARCRPPSSRRYHRRPYESTPPTPPRY